MRAAVEVPGDDELGWEGLDAVGAHHCGDIMTAGRGGGDEGGKGGLGGFEGDKVGAGFRRG